MGDCFYFGALSFLFKGIRKKKQDQIHYYTNICSKIFPAQLENGALAKET